MIDILFIIVLVALCIMYGPLTAILVIVGFNIALIALAIIASILE